jgi:hypothetical protein
VTENGRQPPERDASPGGRACRRCDTPLAADQRYCLNCGTRVGPLRLPASRPRARQAPRRRPAPVRLPTPRSAGALAAMMLAFGVFAGFALGPSISGVGFAGGQLVVNVPAQGQDSTNGPGADTASASAAGGAVTLGNPVGSAGGGRSTPPRAATTPVAAVALPPAAPTQTPSPPPAGDQSSPKPHSPAGGHKPPPEHEPPTTGTVVHLNPVAHSYTLATGGGELMPIHTTRLPEPGAHVSVRTKQLFNGTFVEQGERATKGHETEALLGGYVSYRDPEALAYSLSVRGASLLIHLPKQDVAADLPPLGGYRLIRATIEKPAAPDRTRGGDPTTQTADGDGCSAGKGPDAGPVVVLTEERTQFTGPPVHYVDMEGIVGATCTDPGQIVLSADDVRDSTNNLLLNAPAPIDVTKLDQDQAIDVTAELGDDGSYTVTGLSSDQGASGADDPAAAQGDQAP